MENEILSENQAPEKEHLTEDYKPTTEEQNTIKKILKRFKASKSAREKYDKDWLWYYKMFRGRQWKNKRPSYRHSEVINMIFQNIQASVPILVDTQPRMEFVPQEPNDLEFSEILNEVAAYEQERGNWLMELLAAIYDSKFYGAGFLEVGYDEELYNGLGGNTFESADPFYCFPDPNSRNINDRKRGRFFIYAEPMDVELIKDKWPDKGKFVKSDLMDLMKGDKTDLGDVRFVSPVDNKTILEGERDLDMKDDNKALVITCWYVDNYSEKDEPQKDGTLLKKKSYPNGRKTVISNNVILEDRENPFDHGMFPFSRLLNYMLPREFWGISDVEQLESPQTIFNKLVSYSLDVLTIMGNPIWLVPTSSGVDTDNLFNRPGETVEYDGNNAPQRVEGVQLQPYVFGLIDRMKKWFDDISGSQEVSRGSRPEGVDTGIVVTALQEAAQTRLRLQSKFIDACLQECGQMYVQNTLQFYRTPRIIRLTGKDSASAYFRMSIEDRPNAETGETDRVAIVSIPGQEATSTKEYAIRGNFDVKIVTGSSLPFAKAEKTNMAFKLFDAGASDKEQLLKDVDHPEREQILQRLQEQEQKMMEAEMAKQGTPPPAPAA